MNCSKFFAVLFAMAAPFFVTGAAAQQPAPAQLIIQAANAVNTPSAAQPAGPSNSSSSVQAAVKALQQAKAANDETLKKQEATLQQLDELQKAVEQLKIFAKRG